MVAVSRLLTADDLVDLPDDGRRYEIIGGELIVSPAPIPDHQRLLGRLFLLFTTFDPTHQLGEVFFAPLDVLLSEHDQVQPDLIFIASERREIIRRTRIEGPPDLVLDVLSPSTRQTDQVRKAALYATAGVREYWLVDADARAITVLGIRGQHFEPVPQPASVARSDVLNGLEIELAPLFADLA